MDRRAFIAALAAIPAALLAGLGRPPLEALEYVPLAGDGGYLLPLWQNEEIAKLYAVPPELIATEAAYGHAGELERLWLDCLRSSRGPQTIL